jgi:hypothetical protein
VFCGVEKKKKKKTENKKSRMNLKIIKDKDNNGILTSRGVMKTNLTELATWQVKMMRYYSFVKKRK